MKSRRKIVFRIIFLLTIFFCAGINAQSDYIMRKINIENPAGTNNDEKSFGSDSDSIDEDQIDQSPGIASTDEYIRHILTQQSFCLIHTFSVAVWQPPKVF
jgi:hypothetical protein